MKTQYFTNRKDWSKWFEKIKRTTLSPTKSDWNGFGNIRGNYQGFSEPYKRIRIGYIEAARVRPEEFDKRLSHFINKTRENKMISEYGGIDKHYWLNLRVCLPHCIRLKTKCSSFPTDRQTANRKYQTLCRRICALFRFQKTIVFDRQCRT